MDLSLRLFDRVRPLSRPDGRNPRRRVPLRWAKEAADVEAGRFDSGPRPPRVGGGAEAARDVDAARRDPVVQTSLRLDRMLYDAFVRRFGQLVHDVKPA